MALSLVCVLTSRTPRARSLMMTPPPFPPPYHSASLQWRSEALGEAWRVSINKRCFLPSLLLLPCSIEAWGHCCQSLKKPSLRTTVLLPGCVCAPWVPLQMPLSLPTHAAYPQPVRSAQSPAAVHACSFIYVHQFFCPRGQRSAEGL
jgi:hypothetical protein